MPINVNIRPVEKPDLKYLYRWNSQGFLGDWQGFTYRSVARLERRFEAGELNGDDLQMFIVEQKNARCGLCVIRFNSPHTANVGVTLLPKKRGGGMCQEVLGIVMNYLFGNCLVERVEADTDEENEAGIRALERFGFVREGILRHYRFHHGAFHNSIMFSLLRSDWVG